MQVIRAFPSPSYLYPASHMTLTRLLFPLILVTAASCKDITDPAELVWVSVDANSYPVGSEARVTLANTSRVTIGLGLCQRLERKTESGFVDATSIEACPAVLITLRQLRSTELTVPIPVDAIPGTYRIVVPVWVSTTRTVGDATTEEFEVTD